MARLRREMLDSCGEDETVHPASRVVQESIDLQPDAKETRRSPRKKLTKTYVEHQDTITDRTSIKPRLLVAQDVTGAAKPNKQVRLSPLKNLRDMSDLTSQLLGATLLEDPGPRKVRSTAKVTTAYRATTPSLKIDSKRLVETTVQTDVEESVWCGSDTSSDASSDTSEDVLPSPRKFINFPSRKPLAKTAPESSLHLQFATGRPSSTKVDTSSRREISESSRPTSSSDKENNDRAVLRFSPPRLYSPRKKQPSSRPLTPPPASPSKSRLVSPTKRAVRVPTPPLRSSLDAFWNAEAVNDWNDQYSPQKEWSPKKARATRADASTSPTASPKKPQSPIKRTKADIAAKKDWESRKHQVAEAFIGELDQKITAGKVLELTASTGGVHFVWSKTLNTTAGRANWRRETTKTRQLDGSITVTHKHHASIELAEKVIDDEERLLNVVAHEFCHLANFIVSGIKDQPHGKQFKEWGRKCTRVFGQRGVEITTKHSYRIEYKYIWQCSDCGAEFKRHSKSIDPKRHTCGTCRSKLLQIKPVPRKGNGDGAPTGYAAYVKKHFADVKAGLPVGASQKEVMGAVGRRYRAEKAASSALLGQPSSPTSGRELQGASVSSELLRGGSTSATEVDDMTRGLEVITIEGD
ncbi:hypothetical protein LTR48_005457 [Friedmanniomyces endolithicus]|uniref:SprT-like domain-containing protein n=1 Tax=Rachicladosporium monterosium TaxID=1507873 RepID=A0ABR0L3J0_9PEZI|nr:hypothetical protein LTR29_011685 [Friedmanniomyces endolithicus]KAK1091859.1 hypothetical protein LTR48_005457 [Friedmanniomyces endolithicus]KAK5142348.1 hypothetical protein LTR32_005293 [Rachicladosporium monterosium]